ncbi:MAG: pentapeptide repeat-containing protein [Rickettsiales endosymbiont of Dermacentor nuttalli]
MTSPSDYDKNYIRFSKVIEHIINNPKEVASIYRTYDKLSKDYSILLLLELVVKVVIFSIRDINNIMSLARQYINDKISLENLLKKDELWNLLANNKGKISGLLDTLKSETDQIFGTNLDLTKIADQLLNHPNELSNLYRLYNEAILKGNWFDLSTGFINFVNKYPEVSEVMSKNAVGISEYVINYYAKNLEALKTIGFDNPKIFKVLEPFFEKPAVLKQINDLYNQKNFPELVTVLLNFASTSKKFGNFLRENSTGESIECFLKTRSDLMGNLPYDIADNNFAMSSVVPSLLKNYKLLQELNDEYNNRINNPNVSVFPMLSKVSELLADKNVCVSIANNAKNISNVIEAYFQQNPEKVDTLLKPYNLDPSLLKISEVLLKHPEHLQGILKEISSRSPSYINVVNNIINLSKKSPQFTEFLNNQDNQKHIVKFIQTFAVRAGLGNTEGLANLILTRLQDFQPLNGFYNALSQGLQLTGKILQHHETRAEALNLLQNNIVAPIDYVASLKDKIGLGNIIGQDQSLGQFLDKVLKDKENNSNDLYETLINYIRVNSTSDQKIVQAINNRVFTSKKFFDIAFDGLKIKDFDFTGSTLIAGSFKNVVFDNANFSNTVFLTKRAENPNIKQLENISTNFSGATFDPKTLNTLLTAIRSSSRVISRANVVLDNIKLSGDFSNMDLSGISFVNADFSQAKVNGVNFANTNLHNALISKEQLASASNISNIISSANINLEDITFLQVVNDLAQQVGRIKFSNDVGQRHTLSKNIQEALRIAFDQDKYLQKELIELQQISQNYPDLNILVKHLDNTIIDSNDISGSISALVEKLSSYKMAINIAHNLFKGGEKISKSRADDTLKIADHLASIVQELKLENPNINWSQFLNNKELLGEVEFNKTGSLNTASGLSQIYYDRGMRYTKAGYFTGGIQLGDLSSSELKYAVKSYIYGQAVLSKEEKDLTRDLAQSTSNNIFGRNNKLDCERIFQHLTGIFATMKNFGVDIQNFIKNHKEQIIGTLPTQNGLNILSSLTELYYQQTKGTFSLSLAINKISESLASYIKDNLVRLNENVANTLPPNKHINSKDKGRSI